MTVIARDDHLTAGAWAACVKTTPSLGRPGHLGVKRPIFARLADMLKLARMNSRLVSSPASHHGLDKFIISSDFRAVFYSFSLRDNFYPESHSIRRAACFWHDEKNNSDERDTRLKR